MVKHCFNDLVAEADVFGALQLFPVDKLAAIEVLRGVMEAYALGRSWSEIKAMIRGVAPP